MALTWIQQHISAFGGNSSNVLIFGESSGGTTVGVHMTSRNSWGTFQKVSSRSICAFAL